MCFKFNAQSIPGEPSARSITIANAFIRQYFNRDFSWEADYVYYPAGIYSVDERKIMMLFMFLDVSKHVDAAPQSLCCFKIITGGESL